MKFKSKEDLYEYIMEKIFITPYPKYVIVDNEYILDGLFVDYINSIADKSKKTKKAISTNLVEEWYDEIKKHIPYRVNGYTVKALNADAKKLINKLLNGYTKEEIEKLNEGIINYYDTTKFPKTLSNFFLTGEYDNINEMLGGDYYGKVV